MHGAQLMTHAIHSTDGCDEYFGSRWRCKNRSGTCRECKTGPTGENSTARKVRFLRKGCSSSARDSDRETCKVKKVEKRPITTRRSLSRRVKRQCSTRDTTTFSKSEESLLISLSDSQESQKGGPEPASTQAVELPLKRSRDDDDEQGEADAEAVDEKLAIVPAPEVLNFKEAEDDAPAKPEVGTGWNELEMGLYEKGLQIFGKNRYQSLIIRKIMSGKH